MGFNKRILKKDNIINHKNNIIKYLSVDALYITDDFSNKIYNLYIEGKSEEEIIKYINENENEN